jgi:hypothetical protein
MTNVADQASAFFILVDYLFGLAIGVLGCAIFGSVRENHKMSLLRQAPGPVSAGARVFFGLFARDDGYLRSLPPGNDRISGDRCAGDSSGSHGLDSNR